MDNLIQKFTTQIRAVQWDGSDASWNAILELRAERPRTASYYIELEKGTIWIQLAFAETKMLRPGDWLVLDTLGWFHVYGNDAFQMLTK